MNFLSNEDTLLSESDQRSNTDGNPPLKTKSILKKRYNVNKNQVVGDSTLDINYDETLDGFSNDENTVNDASGRGVEDIDDDVSNSFYENRVSFNLKDTEVESGDASTADKPAVKKRKRRGSAFLVDQALASKIPASQLFVYKWPQDEPSYELFILQEQVSDFLEIKSFKRKYPDLYRRPIEINERVYLKENKVVSETQCDLGLTALKLDDILDIMSQEYPEKYREFNNSLNEKRKIIAASQVEKRKSETAKPSKPLDGVKLKELMKKAIKSAAEYNSQLQREKKEGRNSFFDLHTMRIQVPKNTTFQLSSELTKPGSYPVPLIEGQYQDYYKKYTTEELKYLPLNSVLYTLPKPTQILYTEWKHKPADKNENSSDEETDFIENIKVIQHVESPKPLSLPSKTESIISGICYVCQKTSTADQLISCSSCQSYSHPSCLELNPNLVSWNCIRNYEWQCMECKICSKCQQSNDEDKMMFCDRCDRGYHTYCVGVKEVPSGSWLCLTCKLTENQKSTPVKMKINAVLTNSSPGRRGRPPGSLNKPKISQDSPDASNKKGRGRPRKISLDLGDNNTNSRENNNDDDEDDEYSLNSFNYTNTCKIDDNISNQFYAFN